MNTLEKAAASELYNFCRHTGWTAGTDPDSLCAECDEMAQAVIMAISSVPDENNMNRGFGNCPHCRAPRVAHCHECLNDIERDAAHAAGWRMDHLSGFGCIALCPDCRNDKGSSHE